MADSKREHERIDINMPTRVWLSETINSKMVEFEGFSTTANLSIGGTFLNSTWLLPVGYPINLEMQLESGETLAGRAEVIHGLEVGSPRGEPGMGVTFTELDAENRELLLRFFVSERIQEFYENRFLVEFPHLENVMTLKDVSLVVNLWEDREGRLLEMGKPTGKPHHVKVERKSQAKTGTAPRPVATRSAAPTRSATTTRSAASSTTRKATTRAATKAKPKPKTKAKTKAKAKKAKKKSRR